MTNQASTAERQVVITRTFNAPRELVWRMWTEPEHFKRWFGPTNATVPFCTIDLRVGGEYRLATRNPDGLEMWAKGVYREIALQERLVYTQSITDPEGTVVPISHYGFDMDWPLEIEVTVRLASAGSHTVVTVTHTAPVSDFTDMVEHGWRDGLANMAAALEADARKGNTVSKLNMTAEPGRHDIVLTRVFDAPRELVFKAYTDPVTIPQWWGSRVTTTEVDKMDVRKGGVWRFISRDQQGGEFCFNGVYHDVAGPDRLIYTFEWEGMPGHVLLQTVTLTAVDGKTLLTESSVFQTVEDRDGMIAYGMADGAQDTFDRLEELLKTMPGQNRRFRASQASKSHEIDRSQAWPQATR